MDSSFKPMIKAIVNEILGQDGVLYLEIEWESTWLPINAAIKCCGIDVIDRFRKTYCLEKKLQVSSSHLSAKSLTPIATVTSKSAEASLTSSLLKKQTNHSTVLPTKNRGRKTCSSNTQVKNLVKDQLDFNAQQSSAEFLNLNVTTNTSKVSSRAVFNNQIQTTRHDVANVPLSSPFTSVAVVCNSNFITNLNNIGCVDVTKTLSFIKSTAKTTTTRAVNNNNINLNTKTSQFPPLTLFNDTSKLILPVSDALTTSSQSFMNQHVPFSSSSNSFIHQRSIQSEMPMQFNNIQQKEMADRKISQNKSNPADIVSLNQQQSPIQQFFGNVVVARLPFQRHAGLEKIPPTDLMGQMSYSFPFQQQRLDKPFDTMLVQKRPSAQIKPPNTQCFGESQPKQSHFSELLPHQNNVSKALLNYNIAETPPHFQNVPTNGLVKSWIVQTNKIESTLLTNNSTTLSQLQPLTSIYTANNKTPIPLLSQQHAGKPKFTVSNQTLIGQVNATTRICNNTLSPVFSLNNLQVKSYSCSEDNQNHSEHAYSKDSSTVLEQDIVTLPGTSVTSPTKQIKPITVTWDQVDSNLQETYLVELAKLKSSIPTESNSLRNLVKKVTSVSSSSATIMSVASGERVTALNTVENDGIKKVVNPQLTLNLDNSNNGTETSVRSCHLNVISSSAFISSITASNTTSHSQISRKLSNTEKINTSCKEITTVTSSTTTITNTTASSGLQPYTQLDNLYCKYCDNRFVHGRSFAFHLQTSCKRKNLLNESCQGEKTVLLETLDKSSTSSVSTVNLFEGKSVNGTYVKENEEHFKHSLTVSAATTHTNFPITSPIDNQTILPLTGFDQLDDYIDDKITKGSAFMGDLATELQKYVNDDTCNKTMIKKHATANIESSLNDSYSDVDFLKLNSEERNTEEAEIKKHGTATYNGSKKGRKKKLVEQIPENKIFLRNICTGKVGKNKTKNQIRHPSTSRNSVKETTKKSSSTNIKNQINKLSNQEKEVIPKTYENKRSYMPNLLCGNDISPASTIAYDSLDSPLTTDNQFMDLLVPVNQGDYSIDSTNLANEKLSENRTLNPDNNESIKHKYEKKLLKGTKRKRQRKNQTVSSPDLSDARFNSKPRVLNDMESSINIDNENLDSDPISGEKIGEEICSTRHKDINAAKKSDGNNLNGKNPNKFQHEKGVNRLSETQLKDNSVEIPKRRQVKQTRTRKGRRNHFASEQFTDEVNHWLDSVNDLNVNYVNDELNEKRNGKSFESVKPFLDTTSTEEVQAEKENSVMETDKCDDNSPSVLDNKKNILTASNLCDDVVSPTLTVEYDLPEDTPFLPHIDSNILQDYVTQEPIGDISDETHEKTSQIKHHAERNCSTPKSWLSRPKRKESVHETTVPNTLKDAVSSNQNPIELILRPRDRIISSKKKLENSEVPVVLSAEENRENVYDVKREKLYNKKLSKKKKCDNQQIKTNKEKISKSNVKNGNKKEKKRTTNNSSSTNISLEKDYLVQPCNTTENASSLHVIQRHNYLPLYQSDRIDCNEMKIDTSKHTEDLKFKKRINPVRSKNKKKIDSKNDSSVALTYHTKVMSNFNRSKDSDKNDLSLQNHCEPSVSLALNKPFQNPSHSEECKELYVDCYNSENIISNIIGTNGTENRDKKVESAANFSVNQQIKNSENTNNISEEEDSTTTLNINKKIIISKDTNNINEEGEFTTTLNINQQIMNSKDTNNIYEEGESTTTLNINQKIMNSKDTNNIDEEGESTTTLNINKKIMNSKDTNNIDEEWESTTTLNINQKIINSKDTNNIDEEEDSTTTLNINQQIMNSKDINNVDEEENSTTTLNINKKIMISKDTSNIDEEGESTTTLNINQQIMNSKDINNIDEEENSTTTLNINKKIINSKDTNNIDEEEDSTTTLNINQKIINSKDTNNIDEEEDSTTTLNINQQIMNSKDINNVDEEENSTTTLNINKKIMISKDTSNIDEEGESTTTLNINQQIMNSKDINNIDEEENSTTTLNINKKIIISKDTSNIDEEEDSATTLNVNQKIMNSKDTNNIDEEEDSTTTLNINQKIMNSKDTNNIDEEENSTTTLNINKKIMNSKDTNNIDEEEDSTTTLNINKKIMNSKDTNNIDEEEDSTATLNINQKIMNSKDTNNIDEEEDSTTTLNINKKIINSKDTSNIDEEGESTTTLNINQQIGNSNTNNRDNEKKTVMALNVPVKARSLKRAFDVDEEVICSYDVLENDTLKSSISKQKKQDKTTLKNIVNSREILTARRSKSTSVSELDNLKHDSCKNHVVICSSTRRGSEYKGISYCPKIKERFRKRCKKLDDQIKDIKNPDQSPDRTNSTTVFQAQVSTTITDAGSNLPGVEGSTGKEMYKRIDDCNQNKDDSFQIAFQQKLCESYVKEQSQFDPVHARFSVTSPNKVYTTSNNQKHSKIESETLSYQEVSYSKETSTLDTKSPIKESNKSFPVLDNFSTSSVINLMDNNQENESEVDFYSTSAISELPNEREVYCLQDREASSLSISKSYSTSNKRRKFMIQSGKHAHKLDCYISSPPTRNRIEKIVSPRTRSFFLSAYGIQKFHLNVLQPIEELVNITNQLGINLDLLDS